MSEEKGPETAPAPKRKVTMVNVINTHRYRSFHLRHGEKIAPGEQRKIPQPLFDSVKDTITWLKRAERGDVI